MKFPPGRDAFARARGYKKWLISREGQPIGEGALPHAHSIHIARTR